MVAIKARLVLCTDEEANCDSWMEPENLKCPLLVHMSEMNTLIGAILMKMLSGRTCMSTLSTCYQ